MQRLVGKTVKSIIIDPGKEWIEFTLNNNTTLWYDAEGTCCNRCWIETVEDMDNIIEQEIIEVIDHIISRTKIGIDDELEIMNYDLKTKKGICTIDFRNSHNGYYGGSLNFNFKKSTFKDHD